MENKVILLDSNLNNKIGNGFMIHVMKATTVPLSQSAFTQVITFKTADVAADYQLWDYVREKIQKIPSHILMCSHGNITRDEFEQWMYEKHSLHANDAAGVYFFKLLPA